MAEALDAADIMADAHGHSASLCSPTASRSRTSIMLPSTTT
jgi:hypothetical protein